MGAGGCGARSEYSKQLNDSRIKVLQAREDAVQGIIKEAHNKLGAVTADKKAYRSLLTDLTVQARLHPAGHELGCCSTLPGRVMEA